MRISDWSSDVCSSDLADLLDRIDEEAGREHAAPIKIARRTRNAGVRGVEHHRKAEAEADPGIPVLGNDADAVLGQAAAAYQIVPGHQGQFLAAAEPPPDGTSVRWGKR